MLQGSHLSVGSHGVEPPCLASEPMYPIYDRSGVDADGEWPGGPGESTPDIIPLLLHLHAVAKPRLRPAAAPELE